MHQTTPPLLEGPESAFLLLFVQIFLLVCLFFALILNVTDLTFFTLLMLAIGLGAYGWSRAVLKHLQCTLTINATKLFPNDKLTVSIRVINPKLLPLLAKVDLFIPEAFSGNDEDMGRWVSDEIGLLWYQQMVFSRTFFPSRRGVYNLGPPRLRGSDLFGFYFREKTTLDQVEIVVYPQIVNIKPITVPRREFYGIPGARSPVEDPIFVFGTRDYQPGGPARKIHWKASARHNRLQEKLCEPAEQEKILFILDVEQFQNEKDEALFEKMLEVIASSVMQMDHRGAAIGFITNGDIAGGKQKIVPVSRSPVQAALILETLARVGLEATMPVIGILSDGYKVPWGTSSIYFCHNRSLGTRRAEVFMRNINSPIRFVASQKPNTQSVAIKMDNTDSIYMDELLASGKQKI